MRGKKGNKKPVGKPRNIRKAVILQAKKLQQKQKLIQKSKNEDKQVPAEVPIGSAVKTSTYKKNHFIIQEFDDVLLIGEANFSFAASLITILKGDCSKILATTYDSYDISLKKFPDLVSNLSLFKDAGGRALFEIDGTKLASFLKVKNLRKLLQSQSNDMEIEELAVTNTFDKIIFNFPHVGAGIKDQERNIKANQELLVGFLSSSTPFLNPPSATYPRGGEIFVTLKTGKPYDDWEIKKLATKVIPEPLDCKTSFTFDPSRFPGYAHRRTIGYQEGISSEEDNAEILINPPRTYVFIQRKSDETIAKEQEEEKNKKRARAQKAKKWLRDDDSDSD